LDDFTRKVEQVSVAQVKAAFARHINPNAMATIIVGAPEGK
jgi:zinc protease